MFIDVCMFQKLLFRGFDCDVWEHSHPHLFQFRDAAQEKAMKSALEWKNPGKNVTRIEVGLSWNPSESAWTLRPAVWLDVNLDWTPADLDLTTCPDSQINIVIWRPKRKLVAIAQPCVAPIRRGGDVSTQGQLYPRHPTASESFTRLWIPNPLSRVYPDK